MGWVCMNGEYLWQGPFPDEWQKRAEAAEARVKELEQQIDREFEYSLQKARNEYSMQERAETAEARVHELEERLRDLSAAGLKVFDRRNHYKQRAELWHEAARRAWHRTEAYRKTANVHFEAWHLYRIRARELESVVSNLQSVIASQIDTIAYLMGLDDRQESEGGG